MFAKEPKARKGKVKPAKKKLVLWAVWDEILCGAGATFDTKKSAMEYIEQPWFNGSNVKVIKFVEE